MAPVFGMVTDDVNNDGNLDIVMTGNDYGSEVTNGRLDAFNGLVLVGDGKGNFKALVPTDTGFLQEGDVRDIKVIRTPKNRLYFVTRNNDKIQIFKKILPEAI